MTEPPTNVEQCVIVHVRISYPGFGTSEERDSIYRISEMLAEAIMVEGAGAFDGEEFGGGECKLFMDGPDADRLFEAVFPVLKGWQALKGGYAVKRFGPPGSRSEKVEFD
jgi:hypothetical protein